MKPGLEFLAHSVQQSGIVGALILGDAAVKANIVSPILIIIVAITRNMFLCYS